MDKENLPWGKAFPESLWWVLVVYGPIIIFEIFSDLGLLLSKIPYGPENGVIHIIHGRQNWVRAYLRNIRLFDRYNVWGFF